MVEIICPPNRTPERDGIYESGGFRYQADASWAKWPENLTGVHALGGCVDWDGSLIVATEDREHPLTVFDTEGKYQRAFGIGLFQKAHSANFTPVHTLLVADAGMKAHVIREIDLEGRWIRDFGWLGRHGDSGYDPGYLEELRREGRIPKEESWNKRPDFNARLDSIRRCGAPFCRPCSMKVGRSGYYFAADGYGNAAVHKFRPDGTLDRSFGEPGSGPGRFRLVHDLCLDARDRIWVADRENACVHVFDQDGKLLAFCGSGLFRVGSVCADEKWVYVGELDGGITIINLDFQVVARFGSRGCALHAHGLTVDENGDLILFTNKYSKTNNILRLFRS
ncbi:hypothetical protein [Hominifimenecus sp. rT4P-3]|uniref:hypothetical protein n=1 Tax=Hominifimenecus sp. rT4P-3 TaxID=3242979 RepID=UPI003DA4F9D1